MTEFMAYTLETSKTDAKVLNFYVEECLKGSNLLGRDRTAMALMRTSCETQVKNSARAVLMQAAQITQNTYNSLESVMRSAARAPGRKLAFFISDGFLLDAGPPPAGVRENLDHVTDAEKRGGVVVNTIHSAGLENSTSMAPGNNRP